MTIPRKRASGPISRRDFGRAVAATATLGAFAGAARLDGGTTLARIIRGLDPEVRSALDLPPGHWLRTASGPSVPRVGLAIDDLPIEARALVADAFLRLFNDEGRERVGRVIREDMGGIGKARLAIVGGPDDDGPFAGILFGRHLVLRADGRREGVPAAGPVFYGHAAPGPRNLWRDQARLAHRLVRSLGASGRREARTSQGLAFGSLDGSARERAGDLVRAILGPFRAGEAVASSLAIGEFRLRDLDPGGDGGAIWKLEGPGFAWDYYGEPHVHAWLTWPIN